MLYTRISLPHSLREERMDLTKRKHTKLKSQSVRLNAMPDKD